MEYLTVLSGVITLNGKMYFITNNQGKLSSNKGVGYTTAESCNKKYIIPFGISTKTNYQPKTPKKVKPKTHKTVKHPPRKKFKPHPINPSALIHTKPPIGRQRLVISTPLNPPQAPIHEFNVPTVPTNDIRFRKLSGETKPSYIDRIYLIIAKDFPSTDNLLDTLNQIYKNITYNLDLLPTRIKELYIELNQEPVLEQLSQLGWNNKEKNTRLYNTHMGDGNKVITALEKEETDLDTLSQMGYKDKEKTRNLYEVFGGDMYKIVWALNKKIPPLFGLDIQSILSQRKKPIILNNFRATCYLISLLHALFWIPDFIDHLKRNANKNPANFLLAVYGSKKNDTILKNLLDYLEITQTPGEFGPFISEGYDCPVKMLTKLSAAIGLPETFAWKYFNLDVTTSNVLLQKQSNIDKDEGGVAVINESCYALEGDHTKYQALADYSKTRPSLTMPTDIWECQKFSFSIIGKGSFLNEVKTKMAPKQTGKFNIYTKFPKYAIFSNDDPVITNIPTILKAFKIKSHSYSLNSVIYYTQHFGDHYYTLLKKNDATGWWLCNDGSITAIENPPTGDRWRLLIYKKTT